MRINDLDLYNAKFKKKISLKINKIIKNNNFIFGDEVKNIESKLSKFSGTKYAITTGSGTDSLLLSLLSLNKDKKKNQIIIPSFSWLSVAEAVLLLGLEPIYVDVELESYNIDVKDVINKISPKTKAVISTSLFGRTCDLSRLKKICKRHRVILIEDAAQNFGSRVDKKSSLSIADITCTSFFPTKNLGCFGDGGAIFTNNFSTYKKIIKLRNHGQNKYSFSNLPGLNSRIGDIQAGILSIKILDIKNKLRRQKTIYRSYQKFFNKNLITGFPKQRTNDAVNQFSIIVKKRKKLIKEMVKLKIPYKIYYPSPLYKQFQQNVSIKKFKKTNFLCKHIISLPFNDISKYRHNITLLNLQKIINKNKKFFFEKKN